MFSNQVRHTGWTCTPTVMSAGAYDVSIEYAFSTVHKGHQSAKNLMLSRVWVSQLEFQVSESPEVGN